MKHLLLLLLLSTSAWAAFSGAHLTSDQASPATTGTGSTFVLQAGPTLSGVTSFPASTTIDGSGNISTGAGSTSGLRVGDSGSSTVISSSISVRRSGANQAAYLSLISEGEATNTIRNGVGAGAGRKDLEFVNDAAGSWLWYSIGTERFRILAGGGAYLNGSTTQNLAVSSGAGERVERATINSNGTTITSQSGSWVSSGTHPATGSYTLNVTASIFSSAPTCTVTSSDFNNCMTMGSSLPTTSVITVRSRTCSTNGDVDTAYQIICVGAR